MVRFQFLENFDSDELPLHTEPDLESLPGYDAGYEAGVQAADLRQSQLAQTFIDKIVELQFSQAEAQRDVLTSLQPLLSAVCNKILPEIMDDIMRIHVLDTLIQAAKHDLSGGLVLSINPSKADALESILSTTPELKVKVRPDHTLAELDVVIGNNAQETQLDVPSLIDSIRSALNSIIECEERTIKHG